MMIILVVNQKWFDPKSMYAYKVKKQKIFKKNSTIKCSIDSTAQPCCLGWPQPVKQLYKRRFPSDRHHQ